jgi:hypothetical protein
MAAIWISWSDTALRGQFRKECLAILLKFFQANAR